MPDLLTPRGVQQHLKTDQFGRHLIILERVDSTNSFALELVEPPEGTVVLAECQTRGRGRFDRHWISPAHKSVLMSLILKAPSAGVQHPAVTLLAALAVAKTIQQVTGLPAAIKWPNDVLVNDRKVCGILTEAKTVKGRIQFLVTGIGINVNQARRDIPKELFRTATSLRMAGGKIYSRLRIIRRLLEIFEAHHREFTVHGFRPFIREWVRLSSSTLGSQVRVHTGRRVLEGLMVGLEPDGGLLVREDSGEIHKVQAGEVVHLREVRG